MTDILFTYAESLPPAIILSLLSLLITGNGIFISKQQV